MARKSSFVVPSLRAQKRVLLIVANHDDARRRSEFLRHRGYDVDSCGADAAVSMSRTHSYDFIVLPVGATPTVEKVCRRLQRLNPNTTVACLADCMKPIPSLPAGKLLWQGEPLEYFLARLDTLSSIA